MASFSIIFSIFCLNVVNGLDIVSIARCHTYIDITNDKL